MTLFGTALKLSQLTRPSHPGAGGLLDKIPWNAYTKPILF